METDSLGVLRALTDTLSADKSPLIPTPAPTPSFGLMIFQMLLMLIVLAVFLYISLYLFKRLNAKIKNKNQALCFKVHENIYFSAKQGLTAVSFGKKLYIVGFSGNAVNLVDIIEDEEIINSLKVESASETRFSTFFKKLLNRE